jgi:hypothetical protein
MFRTVSSEKPSAYPASAPVAARKCCPCEERLEVRTISVVSRRCPGIRAGGICDQTKKILPIKSDCSRFRRESERNIVSREGPEHKGDGIVIR